jgi:hypothetical protein
MFSSPGKEAQQGASGLGSQLQPIISELQNYTGQQQQAERGAIAGVPNPYFNSAQEMSPAPYRVNPGQTQTFGASGPGTYLANLSSKSAGGAPPPWQPIPRDSFGPAPGGGNGKGGNNGAMLPLNVTSNTGGGGQYGGWAANSGIRGHTTA